MTDQTESKSMTLQERQTQRATHLLGQTLTQAIEYCRLNRLTLTVKEYTGTLPRETYQKYLLTNNRDILILNVVYVYIRDDKIVEVF